MLENQLSVDKIRNSNVREVLIDTSKGLDVMSEIEVGILSPATMQTSRARLTCPPTVDPGERGIL